MEDRGLKINRKKIPEVQRRWKIGYQSNRKPTIRMENWKRVSGILCDRRITLRVNGILYKTIVRPAMM